MLRFLSGLPAALGDDSVRDDVIQVGGRISNSSTTTVGLDRAECDPSISVVLSSDVPQTTALRALKKYAFMKNIVAMPSTSSTEPMYLHHNPGSCATVSPDRLTSRSSSTSRSIERGLVSGV